jgi:hypothetical protein
MLTSLRLGDFKSFKDQTIPLAPLTLLVGANASGKSNFFDAIRFLQGIGLDMPLTEVLLGRWEGGREIWPGLRGGVAEAARLGTDAFRMVSEWRPGLTGKIDPIGPSCPTLGHLIECSTADQPMVIWERLKAGEPPSYLFDTEADALRGKRGLTEGGTIRVAMRRSGRGNNVTSEYPASRSLLGQIAMRPPEQVLPGVLDGCEVLREAMRGSVFLDISPPRMRDYRPRQARELGAQGENISPVLREYCQDPGRQADLIDWISELCAPAIVDIRFDETRHQEVMLELVETGEVPISARSLSDGTLRFLGILAALLTAPEGSMLLIEEIENGLHPTRANLLVGLLEQATRERGVQVIATTHSPLVLQQLSEQALGEAVVFGRVPDEPGSVARRLKDLKDFQEIAARRGVDRLFSTGWLERAL